jgi:hypothetical protein
MKKLAAPYLVALIVSLTTAASPTQEPAPPPKPGPAHEKLAYFVGKWTSQGDIKASAFGPAGKYTFTETCDWLAGKFAILCKDDGSMMGGEFHGLNILSYDQAQNSYIYFQTNNWGENDYYRGSVQGDTWTWTTESTVNGQPIRARFVLKEVSLDAATYSFELAMGSQPLTNIMTGKQTRQK